MAPMRMADSLMRLRSFSSPCGQRWQCAQAAPFWQPCDFQNHAQGRHLPRTCSAEPVDGNPSRPATGEAPANGSAGKWMLSGDAAMGEAAAEAAARAAAAIGLLRGSASATTAAVTAAASHMACACQEAASIAS
eukprot:CAMPEP_0115370304 /NCGR_PEP_ID=MMETSP0270-20121206/106763_1 /TAXON_ID=71861 /ORGANISM="Scrippsiella trochoidea, Strain CCMP3099" /LENGTH=133 /DNA_ID=CAMNT_0002793125 /DNA_START=547 /DNA_END=948 /DNA_ORIENTATION=-